MTQLDPRFLREAQELLGPRGVVTDQAEIAAACTDWTGRFVGHTSEIVQPHTTTEVAGVVSLASAYGVPLVPQGGNTGLVGGSVPLAGEVLLSLRRLQQFISVDPLTAQATASASVTIEALQQEAARHGLEYGVDLASRGSATLGGTVATNAGGIRLLRHGDTRRQLRGIQAVLGDGSVVEHMAGLEKDNTGYDLAGLICGSEGTLAVVTAAKVALVAAQPERVVALVGFKTVADAVIAAHRLRRSLGVLDAAELFLQEGLTLVCEAFGLKQPAMPPASAYGLFEAAGQSDPTAELGAAIDALAGVVGVAVATDHARRADLWAYRERHTDAINRLGPPQKFDVTLPADELAGFLTEISGCIRAVDSEARVWLFGHAADGNVHVNVTGLPADDDRVADVVFERVASAGGSISAEHGIGTAKKRWLHLVRSQEEIAAFRRIKAALDPHGVLNPAVLLPD